MAIEPKDLKILARHLAQKTKWAENHTCPVCGTDKWTVGGPIGAPTYADASVGPGRLGPGAMLFVTLTCNHCLYTMFFQWLPMQAADHG